MTDYVDITDAEVASGAEGDVSLFTRLRDNPIAMAEGASGAPRIANAALEGLPFGIDDCTIGWKLVSAGTLTASVALTGLDDTYQRYKVLLSWAKSGTSGSFQVQLAEGGTARGAVLTLASAIATDEIFCLLDILRLEAPVSSGVALIVQNGWRNNSGSAVALTAGHGTGILYSENDTNINVDRLNCFLSAGTYGGGTAALYGQKDI